jgi:hypothetical protein
MRIRIQLFISVRIRTLINSAATGLQTIQGSILSFQASIVGFQISIVGFQVSIVGVHDPPRLGFEPLSLKLL